VVIRNGKWITSGSQGGSQKYITAELKRNQNNQFQFINAVLQNLKTKRFFDLQNWRLLKKKIQH
jgi:hypothetical protein